MKSKLKACAIAVSLTALPLFAESAGLGRLNVLSGLGQPLRAEIDLVSVQPGEVESLNIAMASPEAYQDAHVDYPSSSLGIKFALNKRDDGQYYIAVRSSQSINEPFLDFLIEVKWDGGRVLREYTALLDPVGYTPGKTIAPIAAPEAAKPRETKPVVTTPAPKPVEAPVSKVETPKVEAPVRKEVAAQPKSDTTGEYTVKKGDTLGTIARNQKQDGVSVEQMLVSLYRNNQDAFDGNNMNRLKAGRVLKVPGKDEVASISAGEAHKEIVAQAEDWKAYRDRLANEGTTRPVDHDKAASQGKITAKVEEPKPAGAAENKEKLQLSKGEGKSIQQKMQAQKEESSARKKALDDAQQRVSDLEQNVKKMEKVLAMKSQHGNDMQTQAESTKALREQAKALEKSGAKEPVKPVEPKPAPEVKAPEAKPVADKSAEQAKAPEKEVVAAKEEPKVAAPEHKEEPKAENKAAEHPAKPKKPKFELPPEPKEESLLDNPLVLIGGLAAVVAGIGGGLLAFLRRRKGGFQDSIITGSDLKSNTVLGNTGGGVISTGVTENSFLTDFSREGLGTIDTDEVDPIAEAEVYMAYGRDAQAEEILKDALARDGSRQEVRLKLLEIYNGRKNVSAFNSVAQDLHSATQGAGSLWSAAAEMGRSLDPENALYQGTSAIGDTVPNMAGVDDDILATAPIDTESAPELEIEPPAEFELPLDEIASADGGVDDAVRQAIASQLDEPLTLDVEPAVPSLDAAPTEETNEAPEFALDFDVLGDVADAGSEKAVDVAEEAATLDFDVQLDLDSPAAEEKLDFEFELPTEEKPAQVAAEEVAPSLPEPDFSLDLEDPIDISVEDTPLDFEQDIDDPVSTKIDLARAYIDMGDKEGAREILEEALKEGNEEQQGIANELLSKI
ncbi:LysM peptidoglycan-binding domain-containing protein [Burkholderiaceae bacterium DAT-1]|nr:LysM peptidoglycan-binding domain-containing protein [Burkholderiaceae bacterium DAT-1]